MLSLRARRWLSAATLGVFAFGVPACSSASSSTSPARPSAASGTASQPSALGNVPVVFSGVAGADRDPLNHMGGYVPDFPGGVKIRSKCTGTTIPRPTRVQATQLKKLMAGESIHRKDDPNNQRMPVRIAAHVCSPDGRVAVLLDTQGNYLVVGDSSEVGDLGPDVQQQNDETLLQGRLQSAAPVWNQGKIREVIAWGIDDGKFVLKKKNGQEWTQVGAAVPVLTEGLGTVTAVLVGAGGRAVVALVDKDGYPPGNHDPLARVSPSKSQVAIPVYDHADRLARKEATDIMDALGALERGGPNRFEMTLVLSMPG